MSNFRVEKQLFIDGNKKIDRNDTIKISLATEEVILGAYMQIKNYSIEIVRRGIVWSFSLEDILNIEKVE